MSGIWGEADTKFVSLSVAMKELLKILKICPTIIDVLAVEERLALVKFDASFFGYGVEDEISELIDDIEALE